VSLLPPLISSSAFPTARATSATSLTPASFLVPCSCLVHGAVLSCATSHAYSSTPLTNPTAVPSTSLPFPNSLLNLPPSLSSKLT